MSTTNGKREFEGKVALVTGAASGIGRAAAVAFARGGANVVVADVGEEGSRQTARLIEEAGRSLAVHCDVTRADHVQAALKKATDAIGRLLERDTAVSAKGNHERCSSGNVVQRLRELAQQRSEGALRHAAVASGLAPVPGRDDGVALAPTKDCQP